MSAIQIPAAVTRYSIDRESSRFALVHKLAAVVRFRRHAPGCLICKNMPEACPFRKRAIREGVLQ